MIEFGSVPKSTSLEIINGIIRISRLYSKMKDIECKVKISKAKIAKLPFFCSNNSHRYPHLYIVYI